MSELRQAGTGNRREARALRVGVVVSRVNDDVTDRLRDGAIETLKARGALDDAIVLLEVPGAFELPMAAARLAAEEELDAIVCVGALIRGQTPHFDHLAAAVAHGVQRVALTTGIPVTFGVLTCDDHAQALARAGGAEGNKGTEAAIAAIELATAYRSLERREEPDRG